MNCCVSSAMALGAGRLVGVLIRMSGIGPRSYGIRNGMCFYFCLGVYLRHGVRVK